MTEAEWLACGYPDSMLTFLRRRASKRKVRLYAVACCRRMFESIGPDSRGQTAVEVAERFADGNATQSELEEAHEESDPDYVPTHACRQAASPARGIEPARVAAGEAAYAVTEYLTKVANLPDADVSFQAFHAAETAAQAHFLRDIFGNPFRPVAFSPSWRTDTAVSLARQMYEARDFSAMPILADALQDAGCDNADILDHCRDASATHVRGCWVVDLVLGKS